MGDLKVGMGQLVRRGSGWGRSEWLGVRAGEGVVVQRR